MLPPPPHCRVRILVALLALTALGPPSLFAQTDAEGLSARFRQVVQDVAPAVVTVRPVGSVVAIDPLTGGFSPLSREPESSAIPGEANGGSGVVIDAARGLVLTSDHLVANRPQLVVILPDGRERPVKAVRRDSKSDLALLTIDPEGLQQAAWGDSDALEIGDWVLAIGQPFGLSGTVTAGIISGQGRSIGAAWYEDLLQTDAAINPGNSGGPLVNLKGEVVGINSAIKTVGGGYEGIGLAVPSARARRVAADLAEFGRVRRSVIGVNIGRISPADAERLRHPGAVAVGSVTPGGPAAQVGMRPGDVIVAVANKPVKGVGMVQSIIEISPVGEPLPISLLRRGQPLTVEVRPQASTPGVSPAATATGTEGRTGNPPPLTPRRTIPAPVNSGRASEPPLESHPIGEPPSAAGANRPLPATDEPPPPTDPAVEPPPPDEVPPTEGPLDETAPATEIEGALPLDDLPIQPVLPDEPPPAEEVPPEPLNTPGPIPESDSDLSVPGEPDPGPTVELRSSPTSRAPLPLEDREALPTSAAVPLPAANAKESAPRGKAEGPAQVGAGEEFADLGFGLSPASPDLIRRYHLDASIRSPVVVSVTPGGPADDAGLEPGMAVQAAAGFKVNTLDDFLTARAGLPQGQDLVVRILKGNRPGVRVILAPEFGTETGGATDPGAFEPLPTSLPDPVPSPD